MIMAYLSRFQSAALKLLFISLLGVQCAVSALANQQITEKKPTHRVNSLIGMGLGFRTSIYKSGRSSYIPNLFLDKDRFFIRGSLFGYRYYTSDDWTLDLGIKIDSFGDQHDDSPQINAIEGVNDVDKWVNATLGAEYKLNSHLVRFDISHDISGEHGGSQVALEYAYNFDFGRLKLSPFGGMQWWSEEITDHLFGGTVDSTDASQHRPGSMLHGILGFQILYWITQHHAVHLRMKHTLCDSAVNDSPLVATDQYTHSTLTYVYRF
jgi:outer membrane scaffolding protein for murein synthesis (MipA/OmpV family)